MKITQPTLEFWRQHKAPTPSWAKHLKQRDHLVNIDTVINAQAGIRRTDGELAALNLISLVQLKMRVDAKKGYKTNLFGYLWQIADHPGTVINPAKRAAFARKWAERLYRQEREQREQHRETNPRD